MFYKELRHAKLKFTVLFVSFFSPIFINLQLVTGHYGTDFTYRNWFVLNIIVIVGAGILFGATTFADEQDKGTLNFLLARPVSRISIYLGKFGVNFMIIAIAFLTADLLVFLLGHTLGNYSQVKTAVGLSLLTLLIGFISFSLTSLISIFSSTTYQAIACSVIAVVSIIFLIIFLNLMLHPPLDLYVFVFNDVFEQSMTTMLVVSTLAVAILLGVGMYAFKQRDF